MNILLVYPENPDTFWSFKHALRFIFKKATHPPLGLLTIAGMMPAEYNLKLLDMNVEVLKDNDINWADCVFISAMIIQKESVRKIIKTCQKYNKKIVAGGPLFTAAYQDYPEIDHFVLNEAELTFAGFLRDLEKGTLRRIYRSNEFPKLDSTPVPRWDLVKMKKYASMNLQYSRGCPFNCDFCDITTLFGRRVRTKNKFQILKELESLYSYGWKGDVFFVDDNFIGNKRKLKDEILPMIIKWMEEHGRPFSFGTEASINLADDDELLSLMVRAGFDTVFIGIETTDENSLAECSKVQNRNRDMVASVKKIQRSGLEVTGGFIVGFDSDKPSIFKSQIEFIQKSSIVTAMVGILNAPYNSALYKRLFKENRIIKNPTGSNTDMTTNFIPKMNYQILLEGYRTIVSTIYSPNNFYKRIRSFLRNYKGVNRSNTFSFKYLIAFLKSIFRLGFVDRGRYHYWKTLIWSIFSRPRFFPMAVTLSIYGFHFRKTLKI